MFSNVDTLTNEKICELKTTIESMSEKPMIIALQEVKPKNFKYDRLLAEYNLEGYEIIHKNLEKSSRGRGMLIYIQQSLKYTSVNIDIDFEEYLCIEIKLSGNDKLLFSSIYRSPSSTQLENQKLCELLRKICNMKYSHYITVGDYNLPKIDWRNCTTPAGPGDVHFEFIETLRDCFWEQHVTEPTRGRSDSSPSLIDLVISNEEGMVGDINILQPLGKSDHSTIVFKFLGYTKGQKEKVRLDYNKADYENMKNLLEVDWDDILSGDVDNQWKVFRNRLSCAIDLCIPQKVIRNTKRKKTIFVSRKLKAKMKRKERLWKRYRLHGDEVVYEQYKRVRNQVRRLSRQSVKDHEKHIAQSAKETLRNSGHM